MVDDKFVDLDELVPDTEITPEPVKKKEQSQQKQQQSLAQAVPPQKEKAVPQVPKEEKKAIEKEVKQESKQMPKQTSKQEQKILPKSASKSVPKVPQKSAPQKLAAQKPIQKQIVSVSTKPIPKKAVVAEKKKALPILKKKEFKREKKESMKQSRSTLPERKTRERGSKTKATNWVLISLLILAVIAVGVVLYFILYAKGVTTDRVVALVNGQPIYKSEITSRYNLMKTTMNPLITEEQVLNMTITDKLLLQEAVKKGIVTSDQEVADVLQGVMKTNNIDDAALRADLASKNLTYEYIFKLYKDTLTINKLLNASFANANVAEEDIQAFYDKNKNVLVVPDMVQVRHILVQFSNVSENETYAAASAIADKVNLDRSNFCELVKTYTNDTASADTCGEYNFSKTDALVPEFLDAGFEMKPADVRIMKTQFGYHVMYKVADLKGYTPTLDSLRDKIEPVVKQQKAIDEYKAYVDMLWNSSSIEIYNEGVLVNKYSAMTSAESTGNGSQATANEQINADSSSNQTAQATVVVQIVSDTPQSLLAKCLTQSDAKVFVASWSPDVKIQFDMFGDAKSKLVTVECDPENAAADMPACNAALKKQYPTWPTWQINGTIVEGIQSLNSLAKQSGCAYTP